MSCDTCQKVARKRARDKAPLVPILAIGQPFQRVGIDMVGPLPLTKWRNRYILVVVDYASRYPEAVTVPTLEASRISEELITIFSRVGIPLEVLTDQGTNFQSELFQEV